MNGGGGPLLFSLPCLTLFRYAVKLELQIDLKPGLETKVGSLRPIIMFLSFRWEPYVCGYKSLLKGPWSS